MGVQVSHVIETYMDPDLVPNITKPPTHDPLRGFPQGRKERELVVSTCPFFLISQFYFRPFRSVETLFLAYDAY